MLSPNDVHVVYGSGPVGTAVVETLLERGQRVRLPAGATRLRVTGHPNRGKSKRRLAPGWYRVRVDSYSPPSELASGLTASRIPPRSFVFRLQGPRERSGGLRRGG